MTCSAEECYVVVHLLLKNMSDVITRVGASVSCPKPQCCDFLGLFECSNFQTLYDDICYWALPKASAVGPQERGREGGRERETETERFITQGLRFWATTYTYLQRRTGFITWFLAYCHLCGLMWFCSYLCWLPFSPCLQWKCLHSHFCRHPRVQNTIFLH